MPTTPRRILITGATRGLGRALVAAFAKAGHTLAGCGRSAQAVDDLRRAYGPPHDFATLDVSDGPAVAAWAARVLAAIGAPDLLGSTEI